MINAELFWDAFINISDQLKQARNQKNFGGFENPSERTFEEHCDCEGASSVGLAGSEFLNHRQASEAKIR